MANKKINELSEKSTELKDDDLILVYDSEEAGSEKTKKVSISNYISVVDTTDVYVATTGNDTTGDGSSGSPFATVNKAIEWTYGKIPAGSGWNWNIHIADGTYNSVERILVRGWGPIYCRYNITGNTTNPENVVFNFAASQTDGIGIYNGTRVYIKGLTLNSSNSGNENGVRNSNNVWAQFEDVRITGNWTYGMLVSNNSYVILQDLYIDGTGGITHGIKTDEFAFASFTVGYSNTIQNVSGNALYASNSSSIRVLSVPSFSNNGANYYPTVNTEGNNFSMIYNS